MKKFMLGLAVVAACGIAGCSSLQVANQQSLINNKALSTDGTSIAHVNGSASGLYFLKWPLITGSTTNPGGIDFGKPCDVTATTAMVTKKAKELGATAATDVVSIPASSMLLGPIPFLFYWKSTNVSANAIK